MPIGIAPTVSARSLDEREQLLKQHVSEQLLEHKSEACVLVEA